MSRLLYSLGAVVLAALVAVGVSAMSASRASGAEPTKLKLLFLGDNGHHVPATRFKELQPVLAARGVDLTYTDRMEDVNPATLRQYAGLVVYANIDRIEPDQAKALLDYVAGGAGFIPLHCASYCFRNSDEVVALMGAQFQRHGTGVFRVKPALPDHPVVKGFKGFESWDETYVHSKHNDKNRTVLEYREDAEGREPWTWVRTHGKGRVFYTAWGHDNRTWNHPGFHNLVERGIRWAVGDDPSQVPAFSDGPEMTALRKDLKPFEYVEADIPFYPPGKQWGALDKETKRKMQLPVSPEESVKHMVTPAGFDIRLFVSEAKLQGKPIAMAWDERGRLWLCETLDYPNELQPAGKGRDRIRICEDTDGDGKADKFAVFAEQLSIPSSIAFYRGGAIVQDGTNTLYLKDVDGDDKADIRKTLATGWALGDTHGGVSNFQYGLDNWYYGMQGYNNSEPVLADGRRITSFRMGFFRFRMKGDGQQTEIADLEFLRSTNNNTWGLGLSEEGLVFGSTANGNPSEFMPIPNRYYEAVRGWSSTVLNGIADSNKFDPLDPNKVRQVDHHGGFTAAAGHALYTARNYPQEYWNRTAFVTEPTGHLVATFVIRGDGAGFRSKNSWNLLASDDEWCAPIMAEVGPDGNVWVLDWYNFIVQHNPTPAGFKTGKGNAYESELRDKKHGRIYRLVYVGEKAGDKSADKASSKSSDSVSTLSLTSSTPAAQLVAALKSDNYFWRRQAQRLLVERGQRDVVPALVEILADRSVDAIGLNTAVNHALWTLQGLGVLDGKAENAAAEEAVLKVVKEHRSAGAVRNAILVAPPTAQAVQVVASAPLAAKDPQVRLAVLLWLADLPAGGKIGREMAKVLAIEADPSETERTWIGANGEAVGKAVAEVTRPTTDRWLLDAATAAAARHDREFLKAVILELRGRAGDGPVAKKSAFQSTGAHDRLRIVAEHYARSAPADSISELIAGLPKAAPADAESILIGWAKGWPRDKRLELSADAEQALVKLVTTVPPAGRGALVNLASRWGSKALEAHVAEIAKSFLTAAADDKAKDSDRAAAARQLIEFRKTDAGAAADLAKLITPRSSVELSSGIVEAIGASEAEEVGAKLVDLLKVLTPSVRPVAVRALLGRADWTRAMLDGIEAGKLQLTDLSLDQKQALASHPDRAIAARVKPLMAKGGGLPNPDRQKVIDELKAIVEQKGDAPAGKAVFIKTCAKCHSHGSVKPEDLVAAGQTPPQPASGQSTRSLGPDLTGMAVHPKHELLIHILDPSRSVEGNFRIYTVQTDDGKIVNGLLASESKTAIEVVDSEAKRYTILRENIEELTASTKSLMPEGFEKQITPVDLTNLLEFLTQRGKFLPIPLDKVATITSVKGMFNAESADVERLIFPDWKPKVFEGVPFVLVDPQDGKVPNVIMLHGANGGLPPKMPRQVTLPCNSPAKAIHFLSGVSGWGFPASQNGTQTVTLRLKYADGQTEDHALVNGEHFADYIRRVDVPKSKFAYPLRGQQIRYFAVLPKRAEKIESIDLIKGRDVTSPVFMAVTVETQ